MPGSANLPGELATARQRRSRGLGGVGLGSRRGLPIPRTRIAASPLLGAASAVIVAGAALAAIVGGGGNHMLAAKQLATKQPSASSSHCAGLTDPAELLRSCPRAFERPAPDP